jgi:uncharacterized damage-inducible protein DinB
MNREDIQTLFAYNAWANERIMQAAAQLSPEQFTAAVRLSHGSLRTTLVHLVSAENVWRQRTQAGVSPAAMLGEADFPMFDALRKFWVEEDQAWISYAGSLTDAGLQQVVNYKNTRGVSFSMTQWQILAHVVNHGTQTRSEAGIALTEFGRSPGDLDLIKYLRER